MCMYQRGRPQAGSRSVEPADRAKLRAVGVITLVGIRAVHFLQVVPTLEATPLADRRAG